MPRTGPASAILWPTRTIAGFRPTRRRSARAVWITERRPASTILIGWRRSTGATRAARRLIVCSIGWRRRRAGTIIARSTGTASEPAPALKHSATAGTTKAAAGASEHHRPAAHIEIAMKLLNLLDFRLQRLPLLVGDVERLFDTLNAGRLHPPHRRRVAWPGAALRLLLRHHGQGQRHRTKHSEYRCFSHGFPFCLPAWTSRLYETPP